MPLKENNLLDNFRFEVKILALDVLMLTLYKVDCLGMDAGMER